MAGDTSGVLQLASNGTTTAVTIDTSQNVGIGTTSPSTYTNAKLVVTNPSSGSVTPADIVMPRNTGVQVNQPTTYSTADEGRFSFYQGDSSVGYSRFLDIVSNGYGGTAPSVIRFYTAPGSAVPTERMRIDGSGNVLVAKTSAYSDGTIGTPIFQVTSLYGARAGGVFIANSTSNVAQIGFVNPNGTVGSISSSGSATAYVTSSDYRLKENIVPMTGALDKVAQLKPVTYTWKADNSAGQGFIAHELQEVVPDCVTGEKDAVDADGKPIYQGVDTSFLVATLTAAIQEQQTIINDLKARITALEGAK